VHDQTFRLVRQSTGYDIDEVDSFLDQVEGEFTRLHEALAARGGPDAGMDGGSSVVGEGRQAADQQGAADSAAAILAMAQRTADEYLAAARARADDLVTRAEAERASLEAECAALAEQLGRLRWQEKQLREELVEYLEARLAELRAYSGASAGRRAVEE
jgi:DivIVA domain-containing protein